MTIRERIKLCLILSGALTIILFSYITWISNNNVGDSLEITFMSAESFFQVAWTLRSGGMAADTRVEISARPMPQEPMVRSVSFLKNIIRIFNIVSSVVHHHEPRDVTQLW